MDINKYIALFLVKNKYCSLPGLGTLTLEKVAANKNGENIDAPRHTISFKNVGSIDDQLPHFIGVQENISTNNASNALSVFAKEVKAELKEGNPFVLEGLGRFISSNGNISFQQQSDLDIAEFSQQLPPPPEVPKITVQTNSVINKVNDDLKENIRNKPRAEIGLAKFLIPASLLAVLAIGGYYAYTKMNTTPKEASATETTNTNVDAAQTADTVNANIIADTNSVNTATTATTVSAPVVKDSTIAPTAAVASGRAMKVVIQTYKTEMEANKRVAVLTKIGKPVSMLPTDSGAYHVVLSLPSTSNTPTIVLDSLRKFFNPKGNVFEVK